MRNINLSIIISNVTFKFNNDSDSIKRGHILLKIILLDLLINTSCSSLPYLPNRRHAVCKNGKWHTPMRRAHLAKLRNKDIFLIIPKSALIDILFNGIACWVAGMIISIMNVTRAIWQSCCLWKLIHFYHVGSDCVVAMYCVMYS